MTLKPLSLDELSAQLKEALHRPNPVIFAGAGVGRRVGYPDWRGFVEFLASECERHGDELSAQLVRKNIESGRFLEAATIFKICDAIPEGEKWKAIAGKFQASPSADQLDRIVPLVGLPVTAIVTTNYEHSLHAARTQSGAPWFAPVELDDGSLRSAVFRRDFFIARIHGRAEMPTSMVVDRRDYDALKANGEYLDFLLEILRSRSCIFFGFSFVDPAIDQILALYADKFGPTYEALHCALIPSSAGALAERLHAVNIKALPYDGGTDHQDLWRAIRLVFESEKEIGAQAAKAPAATPPRAPVHQFVAFAYAQMNSVVEREPIVRVVQDGVVLESIAKLGPDAHEKAIADDIRVSLRLSERESLEVVTASIQRLLAVKSIENKEGGGYTAVARTDTFESDILTLADAVLDRMRIREKILVTAKDRVSARNVLEGVFLWRAWDLAAHFAGSSFGVGDLSGTVAQLVMAELKQRTLSAPGAMERAVVQLLHAPDTSESALLAKLGRLAFGLQLVLATPRQALFRRYSLPERIYLDANVLLPAITEGHPLQPVYVDALRRLEQAGRAAGFTLEVLVGDQFLNEIVSHRRIAIETVREAKLEDPQTLRRHVGFYSAINTNVFIGAFASFVGRRNEKVSFDEFLERTAPYETEDELATYLESLRIKSVSMRFVDRNNAEFASLFSGLRGVYEEMADDRSARPKETLLIEHEAQQLTQMRMDALANKRSLFITADNRFRRAVQRLADAHDLAGSSVSHLGLVALVDVMVGLEADSRSLTRLVWAAPSGDEEQAVFDYLVNLALRQYDEALAMEMQEAARRCAKEAVADAENNGVELFGKDATDVAASAMLLDRHEDHFYQYMREAMEKHERDKAK